ncbi:MAG: DUF2135 domain-containing protein [Chitinispirillia bacterium]|nr:DUF2135 domain-containing protein [Chitinispirillia bacterium]MCL2242605.1 DUF2135 domain-containing protein [Chitinispirillia bacterium]
MKSSKPLLITIMTIFLFAAFGLSIAQDTKNEDPRQDAAAADAVEPDADAEETFSPQAKLPALNIGGKEDPSVYLQSLDISVEVTGNIASTRYTMVFRNKTNRILEGELTFPLPDGRTVTHYALDINGKMREAVPVEKARAAQVFEEIQRRQVDPGLLERVEGNNFRTRIYPIPAKGSRTISIGYEEELSLEKESLRYRLPLAYPNPLEKFSVKATVWKGSQKPVVPDDDNEIRFDKAGENYVASFSRQNYRPARALNFALPAAAGVPQVMMQSAQGSYYFLASVAPDMGTRKKQWGDELAIIWDVSLSGTQRDLQRETEALTALFSEKKNADVHLYFLSNTFRKVVNKSAASGAYKVTNGNWSGLKDVLEMAVYDGGTDFSKISLKNITGNEILFFSDGISTLSDADFLKKSAGDRPIHCIVSSAKADYSAMKLIAGKTKGKFININALSSAKLKSEFLNETPQFLGTEGAASVTEIYPGIATPVYGSFSVAGISETNNAELTLLFGFGNKVEKRIKIQLDAKNAGNHGNIYKIWAQKKISELDLNYEKNRAELTALGQQFGIVTRSTSFIVLELISDYIHYNIEPPASEPALRAEYRRMIKSLDKRRRSREFNLLDMAVADAGNVKKWRGANFAPQKKQYPIPDKHHEAESETGWQYESIAPAIPLNTAVKTQSGVTDLFAAAAPEKPEAKSGSRTAAADTALRRSAGSANAAVTHTGVLGIVTGQTRGKSVATTDVFGSGGLAADIDTIISGVGSLKSGGGVGRKGAAGIGYGSGYGSGFGGGGSGGADIKAAFTGVDGLNSGGGSAGGIGDVLGALMGGSGLNTQGEFRDGSLKETAAKVKVERTKQPAEKNNQPYLNKLTGKTADDYLTYLKIRDGHANSPEFYFNMAAWFYKHGDKDAALCVLTSIAELDLENASLYRLLGYHFKEYGEYALQEFVCQKVLRWRPMEPQSYRDYALALADNGEAQAALDSLYGTLTRYYPENTVSRCRGTSEVIVTEINRLIAQKPELNTSKIDKRILIPIPIDLRVVINWNMDNTDIDLYVKDPAGNECSFSSTRTPAGGRISADNTGGYGPEQFLLKNAMKGKYLVSVNYFSAREFAAAGPATVMAEIYTKYADKGEQRRVLTLQLPRSERDGGNVLVAEFEL